MTAPCRLHWSGSGAASFVLAIYHTSTQHVIFLPCALFITCHVPVTVFLTSSHWCRDSCSEPEGMSSTDSDVIYPQLFL